MNKAVRGGFTFNVMCIGETGLGKSTLMDSLFNTSFESMPADHKSPDVKLKSRTYELEESSVRLNVSHSALMFEILDHFRRDRVGYPALLEVVAAIQI